MQESGTGRARPGRQCFTHDRVDKAQPGSLLGEEAAPGAVLQLVEEEARSLLGDSGQQVEIDVGAQRGCGPQRRLGRRPGSRHARGDRVGDRRREAPTRLGTLFVSGCIRCREFDQEEWVAAAALVERPGPVVADDRAGRIEIEETETQHDVSDRR